MQSSMPYCTVATVPNHLRPIKHHRNICFPVFITFSIRISSEHNPTVLPQRTCIGTPGTYPWRWHDRACGKLCTTIGKPEYTCSLWWGSCRGLYIQMLLRHLLTKELHWSYTTSVLLIIVKMLSPKSLLFLTIAVLLHLASSTNATQLKQKPLAEYISYYSVLGFFLQDLNSTNTSTFNFVPYHPEIPFPFRREKFF
jgi:hypothetical protein